MGEHAEGCPGEGFPKCTCGDGALESWREACAKAEAERDLETARANALGLRLSDAQAERDNALDQRDRLLADHGDGAEYVHVQMLTKERDEARAELQARAICEHVCECDRDVGRWRAVRPALVELRDVLDDEDSGPQHVKRACDATLAALAAAEGGEL